MKIAHFRLSVSAQSGLEFGSGDMALLLLKGPLPECLSCSQRQDLSAAQGEDCLTVSCGGRAFAHFILKLP